MADMRKLIESVDSLSEASIKTVANSEAFIKDITRAFGGLKDQTLNIQVTLKGDNVLEYSIKKVEPRVSPSEEEKLGKARANRGYF